MIQMGFSFVYYLKSFITKTSDRKLLEKISNIESVVHIMAINLQIVANAEARLDVIRVRRCCVKSRVVLARHLRTSHREKTEDSHGTVSWKIPQQICI